MQLFYLKLHHFSVVAVTLRWISFYRHKRMQLIGMHKNHWNQMYLFRIYSHAHSDIEYVYSRRNKMNYKRFQSTKSWGDKKQCDCTWVINNSNITVKYKKLNYQIACRLYLWNRKLSILSYLFSSSTLSGEHDGLSNM